ncbi:DNA-directed RNA polymerase subunit beta [Paenibacillus hamazuiensis]|uniref:DNA-directed RNA polymerase subunit beta n=1 Tax=Paenibacillus hamazuiensis TaxID=2936508 RepID=UPI00200E1BF4|nr:DNA-directed RNA polymerase subunit beta [Paenibacillus hamazuiensis]
MKAEQPKERKQDQAKPKKLRPRWKVILWTVGKVLLVPVLCVAGLIGGLMIGYVYIGGQPVPEVFQMETWKHMVDLVFAAS